jgi:UDP-N-acetylglucosamine enolpyruvyl transferase
MAQHDMNIANQGFPAFRSDLNNALSAIQTNHSGTSRPSGAVAGQIWLDTTKRNKSYFKIF